METPRNELGRDTVQSDVAEEGAATRLPMAKVLRRLFADHLTSEETEQLFKAEFRGHGIHWSGFVIPRRHLESDVVFATGDSVASVGLADLGEVIYSRPEVTALVWFHGRDASKLRIGDGISFTGHLAKIDVGARLLFIVNGRLAG